MPWAAARSTSIGKLRPTGEEWVILFAMASSVRVVDDDPNLVRLMTKFLKLEGFSPVPAANGQEALT